MVTVVTLRPSTTASSVEDRFTENVSAVTSFTLSGCIVMSAAEVDTIREQQLKRTQSGSSKLKRIQSGNSS